MFFDVKKFKITKENLRLRVYCKLKSTNIIKNIQIIRNKVELCGFLENNDILYKFIFLITEKSLPSLKKKIL